MKKSILTLVACMVTMSTVAARPTGLRLGGGNSFNFYTASVDGSALYGGNLGLDKGEFFGAFAEVGYDWTFTGHSALCVGARFNMLFNGKFSDNMAKGKDWAYSGQISTRCYLDIPVMYQFSFNLSQKVQMFIAAGPTVNFWLSNATTFAEASNVESKTAGHIMRANWFKDSAYGNDFYNRVNVSLGGQIGVYFYHVKIYVGYDQGLISFTNKNYCNGTLGQLRTGAAYVF